MFNFIVAFIIGLMFLCAVFFLIVFLIKYLKSDSNTIIDNSLLPYRKKAYLLSKAENNFFFVLNASLDSQKYYICPKVRLSDIFDITDKNNWQSYFNRITMKHVDFLICESKSFKPVLAIELDDSSHNSAKVVKRDEFVNKVYENAGLPCLRVKANYSYTVNELREHFRELVKAF